MQALEEGSLWEVARTDDRWRKDREGEEGSLDGMGLRSGRGVEGSPPQEADHEAESGNVLGRRNTLVLGFDRDNRTGQALGEGCNHQPRRRHRQHHRDQEDHVGRIRQTEEAYEVGGRHQGSVIGHGRLGLAHPAESAEIWRQQ